MKTTSRLSIILSILSAFAASALAQALSPIAQKTVDEYEQYRAALLKDAEAKIAVRRDALVRELEARVATETRAGNLHGALAIKAKIEELKSGYASVPGTAAVAAGAAPAPARGKMGKIDFEGKLAGWRTISPTASAVAEAAHAGRLGLKVEDPAGKTDMFGPLYAMAPNKTYSAQFWARVKTGKLSVGVNCYDAAGKFIGNAGSTVASVEDGSWKSIQFPVRPPPGTNKGSFWIKSSTGFPVTTDLDDFTLDPVQ